MIRVLGQADEFGGKPQLGKPARREQRHDGADELVLLPLQHERIRHFAVEQADVEGSDQFAGGAIAELEQRRLESARRTLGEGLLFETEIGQHFQRRRMDGCGTLILDRLGLRFDEQHWDALAQQSERHDGAYRSGADDNHALLIVGHDSIHTLDMSNVDG
jgi:hypothetical protein